MIDNQHTLIIKSLYFRRKQSIAELSNATGKSIPSITKSITELTEQQFIIDNGPRASTGGRRAKSFSLNSKKLGHLIAIAVDQYHTDITVYDINNNLITSIHKLGNTSTQDSAIYTNIESEIEQIIQNIGKEHFLAIGITTPGFVDSSLGINNSYKPESPLYDIKQRIENKFQINTYLENDSSAIAIAEKHFGKAKESENVLVVNLNWGVGLGMIVQNKLFRGYKGFAGEFSHIPLADESKLCSCGKKGCLEVEASLRSAIEFVIKKITDGEPSLLTEKYNLNKKISFEDLVEAYQNGDQLTIKAIKQIAHMLGKGISTLIHILNPELIVISGKGAIFGKILLSEIQSSVHEYCIPRLAQNTRIEISTLKNAQLLSSACIALEHMKWN